MIKIGLTGPIGSGKTALAALAASALGIPVFDADRFVHDLYARDAGVRQLLVETCGPQVMRDGRIDRTQIAAFMRKPDNAQSWRDLERQLHDFVWREFATFAAGHAAAGARFVIADVPFLFETGAETHFDYTIDVFAPFDTQRARALARAEPRLTEADFAFRHAAFLPAAQRRAKADFTIDNGGDIAAGLLQLRAHLAAMSSPVAAAASAAAEVAVYPGSFDPMTLGHLDVLCSALQMPFHTLYVAVGRSPDKPAYFTPAERVALVEREMDRAIRPYLASGRQVVVTAYDGATVDFMRHVGAHLCIRGLRDARDLAAETALDAVNRGLHGAQPNGAPFVTAYFAPTRPALRHISSSWARAVCALGPDRDLDLLDYVSADVAARMIARRDGKDV